MTRVIDDDRDHARIGTCENCDQSNVLVRPVQEVGWCQESRGYRQICFDCFRSRIRWRPRGEHAAIYTSPAGEDD